MPTPDFIVKLREKIGHDALWLPGVTAVVIRDVPADAPIWAVPEVLLVRRADNGQWTPVTGIVDPGEEPDAAAVREVLEETGLSVQVEALLGVGQVGPVEYPNGDVSSYMDTAMRLSVMKNDATPHHDEPIVGDDESVDVGWFSVAQLPPMQPRFRLVIADAVAQMKHPVGFRPRMGYRKRNGDKLRGD
ncbi:NUDIX domain-containing protein [Corynebacterium sp. 320]|uniref:NUDIX hydrolase n=1 Tax=Corynebacterium TaxID=1716 RepID=UPI00125CCF93|nr:MULTISPECIES: NUDIX domain-containing protein [Corynebacterium]KAB1502823.1 NUDIX domain-containing protein [Corynebacterium sp. 320]KAB1550436.1 NUDIX domain-containing protein [Corynebacterium sp. 319]KAB1554833.1 NUDIX domain-containing protein [Corynebacterium sp. 321]KAB3526486.1 NUDIX domain-containing protein [Corynebacterium sp. 250]KAB3539805.1 NUDIX domain-containing protein [Corynebacterium sp. 366]